MILDFDDGDLSPEEFDRIFWREADRGRRRSFLICNTFSRCAEKPNKFRVILFYRRPATTLQQHEAVYDAVVSRLEQNDYTAKSGHLDPACRSVVQSFYLPCTNRAHQQWAFFETRGTKTRDLGRCAIDPVTYGATAVPVRPKVAPDPIIVGAATREQIDAATERLRSMTEGRHREVFMAGSRLRRLGLSKHEIEAQLLSVVGEERHMRKKIPGVIKSLVKYDRL